MSARILETIAVEVDGTGYELVRSPLGHPLVKDEELGRWLQFTRPRNVRQLIQRWETELGEVCCTVQQTSVSGGRPGIEYHLSEEQALFIAAKSETPRATQILKAMIAVFMEARRRLQESALLDQAPADRQLTCFGHGCVGTMHGRTCPEFKGAAEHAAPAVPVPELPLHSVRSGTIELGGFGFGCSILSDGRAVLLLHDFYASFGRRPHKGHGLKEGESRSRLPAVLLRPGLDSFVSARLAKLLEPIRYRGRGGRADAPQLVGIDPEAVTEVCAAIVRALAARKIHPQSTKAVPAAVKVLAAIATRPWAARIEEACGGSTALARPAQTGLAGAGSAPERDPYEAIADAVVQRLRARRLPVTQRMAEPDLGELRLRLANIEMMLLAQAAREDDL